MSRHLTLSELEDRADSPWQSRFRPYTDTQRRESVHEPFGSTDCWCGELLGHDWPGKDDGAPHPR